MSECCDGHSHSHSLDDSHSDFRTGTYQQKTHLTYQQRCREYLGTSGIASVGFHLGFPTQDPDRVDSPFLGGPLPPTSPGTPVVTELPLPGSPTHAPPLPTTPSQTLRTGSAQRMQVDELMPVIEHLRKSDSWRY